MIIFISWKHIPEIIKKHLREIPSTKKCYKMMQICENCWQPPPGGTITLVTILMDLTGIWGTRVGGASIWGRAGGFSRCQSVLPGMDFLAESSPSGLKQHKHERNEIQCIMFSHLSETYCSASLCSNMTFSSDNLDSFTMSLFQSWAFPW